jgi:hypothetical protein
MPTSHDEPEGGPAMLHNLTTRIALVLVLAVMAPPPTGAADQTVLGKQLVVKNPSTPDRRKVVVKAMEPGSPDTVVRAGEYARAQRRG